MEGTFTLFAGVERATIEADGATVGDVRDRFADAYNISTSANALVNGRTVEEDFVPKAGDELSFSKATGEKGQN
jgi:molybdopterin converting factor small subunit